MAGLVGILIWVRLADLDGVHPCICSQLNIDWSWLTLTPGVCLFHLGLTLLQATWICSRDRESNPRKLTGTGQIPALEFPHSAGNKAEQDLRGEWGHTLNL